MAGSAIARLLFVSCVLALACLRAFAAQEPFAVRISCGAREDVRTKPTNVLWYRDFGYTGGRYTNASLTSSIVPPLKTLRYFPLSDGPENCYIINRIPNGHYAVRMFFALVADSNLSNEPVFDISVEGTQVYSMKPRWSNNDDQSFTEVLVFVTDKSLSLCFHSTGHGDPSVLSIEILQVDANAYNYGLSWSKVVVLRTAKRLTCGTGKPAFDEDYNGNHWGGDRFWLGISTFSQGSDQSISTENRIAEASIAPNFYPEKLYHSAIVSTDQQPDLIFEMEVDPSKNYSLWFHFAEIDPRVTNEEQRVFDILVNGDVIFEKIDIIRMAGEGHTALVLNRTVAVSGRILTIILHPTEGHAIINGIEVFEIIPAELRTLPEEVSTLQILKASLGLPLRLGWNGDPCVPQQHPWSGVDCQYDSKSVKWVIDGLGLDNQGLKGFLPSDISNLKHLQSINLSGNSIQGNIPSSVGTISGLQTLDLSYNEFNGSIPESLGQLKSLQILNLNGNLLSGRVPANLGGRPLHRASFNFTGNAGLCGIPGLRSCGPHLSLGDEVGIALGSLTAFLMLLVCLACWWKRRQNILRAQKIAASREASYAKARTNNARDVQMTRHQQHRVHDQTRTATEASPALLT
ncbi:Putative leucine-rich repeat receptor-like serine/threonine-protein kinase [Apostasia shenzhenica]|uniref:Leucine-rich repeat receptor-like serine/threonine-protein kinase n=1 Tax=Apostasia shenzhenica TaxID=1088818 RepID=A0A2H9ZTR9_9ASPA|nr:Putative leucine-rich repeat receptor-like serine/threonine-protein kinase [Apostasia shenzhenica]